MGCKEDWTSRLGLNPLWRSYVHPFESYPLDRLGQELAADPPRFSFVVLGNTDLSIGEQAEEGEGAVPDKIMDRVRSIRPEPEFIFHLGDVAENPGDTKAWEEWIRKAVPYAPGLDPGEAYIPGQKRCFVLPGERDVVDKEDEVVFLTRFYSSQGKLPFSFDRDDFHFVALNSETTDDSWVMEYFGYNRQNNRISGAQFEWLEKDLALNQGKRIVVFIHKPMFPPVFSSQDGYCLDQHYTDREKLLALLKKHSVRAVFMGHEPIFHWAHVAGTYHIITGGAGRRPRARKGMGGFHHFLYVTVDQESRMTVYCMDPERNTVEGVVQVM